MILVKVANIAAVLRPRLLFFPVDNSRSTDIAKQGLTRLRRILDQLALEAAEDGGFEVLEFEGSNFQAFFNIFLFSAFFSAD